MEKRENMLNWNKKAFTLLELIISIIILAILWTIAFISLQSYSKQSRDSARVSDMSKIRTGLELFSLDAGKYPIPTWWTGVTYSGAIVWTQWTFGESTYKNVSKLDKIPKDPLMDAEYVYSTTINRQEFQLWWVMEWDEITIQRKEINPIFILKATAEEWDKTGILKINGIYNGKIIKVNELNCVLALPSIMTTSGTILEEIISNNLLAYNGYRNLPSQYWWTYKLKWEKNLNLVNSWSLEVYCWDLKLLSDTTELWMSARKMMIEKIQNAYSGTTISNMSEIQSILLTDINDTNSIELLSRSFVNNNLWGSIELDNEILVTYTVTFDWNEWN